MSDATTGVAVLPAGAAPDDLDARLDRSLGERIPDRLNPILVREIQQAMSGKTFLGALMLAVVGVLFVALTAAARGGNTREDGWDAFLLAMRVLAPILLLVVPMQAFVSMRQEVAAGTIEQLLLSRLTPAAVVRGKIYAAGVLSLVFFSVFAPLIALSYLLRGVDVPTIAMALGFAFLYALLAATLGIALGSLSRWPAFRVLPLLVAAIGLTLGTILVTGAMEPLLWFMGRALRGDESVWLVAGTSALPALLGIPLLAMTASAALAHPYENRSTGFRIYGAALLLGILGWIVLATSVAARRWSHTALGDDLAEAAALLAFLMTPFWLFAATEPDRFSPRVRTLVPRSRVLALLSLPFLPGGMRGVLWSALLAALAIVLPWAVPAWFGMPEDATGLRVAVVAWSYVVLYASTGRVLRRTLRRTGLARLLLPFVLGFLMVLPLLVDVLISGRSTGWGPLHVLNPFAVMEHVADHRSTALPAGLAFLALGVLLIQGRAIVASVREVLEASAARRRRASA